MINGGKMKNSKSYVIIGSLILICLVQLGIFWYYGNKKTFLMCDELFTYTSSNNAEIQAFDMPLNQWLDKEWYLSQTTATQEHTFEYAIPYRNQVADVHPPLYYMLIHTLSSFLPGRVSIAAGVGLNIIFMLGCTILIYFVTTEIFKNTGTGLLTAALFGVTFGACNIILFVRMYAMAAFLLLAHVYVCLHLLGRKKFTWKAYMFYGVTLILGVLTHYYFILLAFFLAVWYFVKLWLEKRYKEDCIFHVEIEVCALAALAVFPSMWKHIFNDYRGEGARKSLLQLSGFKGALKNMFSYVNEQLFGGFLIGLLFLAAVLLAVYVWKRKRFPWKELDSLFPVLFMTGGYFVLVTKIAPYITDRYLMPIYPFVYLIVMGGICWLLGKFVKQRAAWAICGAAFLGMSVGTFAREVPEYAFVDFRPHLELAGEYSDNYCVYIDREYDWWEYYNVVQLLKEYKGFYCISYAAITDDIRGGMEKLDGEKQVIVCVGNSELDEEITAYIGETVRAKKMTLIDEYNRWKIYLAER